MIRALTIRFGIMGIGAGALVILLNVLDAAPALAMVSLVAYLLVGSLIIAGYCVSHEDEIPMGIQRRRPRRH
jgi:hypothetical protein